MSHVTPTPLMPAPGWSMPLPLPMPVPGPMPGAPIAPLPSPQVELTPELRELISPQPPEAREDTGPSLDSRLISGAIGAAAGAIIALSIMLPGGRYNRQVAATQLTKQYMRFHDGHIWLAVGAAVGGLFGLQSGALDPRGAPDPPPYMRRSSTYNSY